MKSDQLQETYYNLKDDCDDYFYQLYHQLEKDILINEEEDDTVYLDYLNQSSGKFEECTLVSIDSMGNIIVNDRDLEENVEVYISDFMVADKLQLIQVIEDYNFKNLNYE